MPGAVISYLDALPLGIRGWCVEATLSGNKVDYRVKAEGHTYATGTINSQRLDDALALYEEALAYYLARTQ